MFVVSSPRAVVFWMVSVTQSSGQNAPSVVALRHFKYDCNRSSDVIVLSVLAVTNLLLVVRHQRRGKVIFILFVLLLQAIVPLGCLSFLESTTGWLEMR